MDRVGKGEGYGERYQRAALSVSRLDSNFLNNGRAAQGMDTLMCEDIRRLGKQIRRIMRWMDAPSAQAFPGSP